MSQSLPLSPAGRQSPRHHRRDSDGTGSGSTQGRAGLLAWSGPVQDSNPEPWHCRAPGKDSRHANRQGYLPATRKCRTPPLQPAHEVVALVTVGRQQCVLIVDGSAAWDSWPIRQGSGSGGLTATLRRLRHMSRFSDGAHEGRGAGRDMRQAFRPDAASGGADLHPRHGGREMKTGSRRLVRPPCKTWPHLADLTWLPAVMQVDGHRVQPSPDRDHGCRAGIAVGSLCRGKRGCLGFQAG